MTHHEPGTGNETPSVGQPPIRVMMVDDDPLIVELHRSYVERVEGFTVVAEAVSARDALAVLLDREACVDLLLLDVTMPAGSGIDVLKHIRARGINTHAIVVSGVRDAEVVRQAVKLGVFQYLLKPFTFATMRDRLEQFRGLHAHEVQATGQTTQHDVDSLFAALRPSHREQLTKGLSGETLRLVTDTLRARGASSAAELAEAAGMSRVAARRYLEHLVSSGSVERAPRHGTPGRPQSEYRWLGE
ncbi:response regulator of citrate/malate metabolism [Leucobacter exalbidus]|uniref:Transcriptional regulatory protein n=1 Tax=Leucobacter exalbidus TaxID=662960 RepID=A0A940PV53_9MICO|nr:response regulator [Leucobacter exalbidus]MBP1325869.1 response regulator of citrate/malate metabolism [Leucobacter exalbidus]